MKVSLRGPSTALLLLASQSPAAATCPSSQVSVPPVVDGTAGALQLAEALNCSSGSFDVEWVGSVVVEETIRVFEGTALVISGAADFTSSANGAGRTSLFEVDGGTLHLHRLSLVNGAGIRGGAIYATDSFLTAARCTLSNNSAENGGAMFLEYSVSVISHSSFTGNTASEDGGAMYIGSSNVTLGENVLFDNNTASIGGAMHLIGGSIAILAGNNASFVSNSAAVTEGGLCAEQSTVNVSGNAEFVGNHAEYGGGISAYHCSISVDGDVRLIGNVAIDSGGGVSADYSVVNIAGKVAWKNNSALVTGGSLTLYFTAVHVQVLGMATFVGNSAMFGGSAYIDESSLVVDGDILFANNSGGALYSEVSVIDISGNALWETNRSPEGGGGLVMWKTYFTVQLSGRAAFIENVAEYGGAVYMDNSTIQAYGDVLFTGNIARNDSGGSVYAAYSVIIVVGGVVWSNNLASVSGGGLTMWESSLQVRSSGKSEFIGNAAQYGGGADINNGAVFVDGEALFADNFADDSGGAVDIDVSVFDIAGRVVIENNTATWDGGGVAASWSDTTIQQAGTASFLGNSAWNAGAIYLDNDTLSVHGKVLFADNAATDRGGAVNSDHSNFTVAATGTAVWKNNTSANQGGGMAMYESTAEFQAGSSASFSYNSAVAGGGMSLSEYASVSMAGLVTFANNSAGSGAGMQMTQFSSASLEGDITMFGNRASSNGGAMHCESPTMLMIDGARFVSNYASVNGGAVMAILAGSERTAETEAEPAGITNCWFSENKAEGTAGALFVAGGFISVAGTQFHCNTAGLSGGAVLASGIVTLAWCGFVGNQASTGSAISTTVSVTISSTDFTNNTLLCDDRALFLDWHDASAYDVACESCPDDCNNCTVERPNRVQECETVLDHTTSLEASGALESLSLHAGYWRSSAKSEEIRECYQTSACPGGTEEYCQTGYEGPFCAVCAAGYTSGLSYTCSKCSTDRRNAVFATAGVVLFVLAVGSIVLGVKHLRPSGARPALPRRPSSRAVAKIQSFFKRVSASPALKIVIVSWQIVSQFSVVVSVTYPSIYETFVSYINVVNLNLGWILSAGCLIDTNFYDGLLLSTIAPLVILAFVGMSHMVARCRTPAEDQAALSRTDRRHVSILLWVSFLVYSTVSSSIFQTFACDDIDNGKSYLRADHSVECYTSKHTIFMVYAGIMTVLYPFGIPLCYALVLHRDRAVLKSEAGRASMTTDGPAFGELWTMYRPQAYYYEVVECARRVVLSGVVVFVFPNTAGQVATSFLLALFFAALLMVLNPYIDSGDTWVARIGHTIVLMSMFVALLQKVDIEEDNGFSQDVFATVLVLANCALILVVGAEAGVMCFVAARGVTA